LSQLTNVGPNLGQGYIIDSFMVVVFGGVGNLWGTLVGGISLSTGEFARGNCGALLPCRTGTLWPSNPHQLPERWQDALNILPKARRRIPVANGTTIRGASIIR
jgi:branched-subunit amino acid ABC-type transport system permease component